MKIIPLRAEGVFTTIGVIKEAAAKAENGMNIVQMRSRIRILDALDNVKDDAILLEDADHITLTEVINTTPWARADRALLQIIDDILNAKEAKAA